MTIKAILQAARDLIAKGWTQGAYARDARDAVTPYGGPSACKFCASGAIAHIIGGNAAASDEWYRALRVLTETTNWPIASWNDQPYRTQADVLSAYDRAIASCP